MMSNMDVSTVDVVADAFTATGVACCPVLLLLPLLSLLLPTPLTLGAADVCAGNPMAAVIALFAAVCPTTNCAWCGCELLCGEKACAASSGNAGYCCCCC